MSEPVSSALPRALANLLPRRLGAAGTAVLLAISLALVGCDNKVSADGNAGGNSARGHVKLGLPF